MSTRLTNKNGTNISFYVADESFSLLKSLDRIGQVKNRSRSYLIIDAIDRYVRLEGKQFPFTSAREASDIR